MIREKMADMAIQTYMAESVVYRTVGMIDAALEGVDRTDREYPAKASDAIREYAMECAICKVIGSEAVDFLVDETVQIHGGYGYTAEFPAERFYRDARINRIFEGTNEVNRLLVPGEFLKRAMKGKLPLMAAAQKLLGEIMEYSPLMVELPDEPLALQAHMIEMIKKSVIFVAGVAAQKFMQKLGKEQELLARIADMAIQTFALESGLLRAKKAVAEKGEAKAAFQMLAVQAYLDETLPKIEAWAKSALAFIDEGDDLRTQLIGLRKLLKYQPINCVGVKKQIAEMVVEKGSYPLD
jgi:alkylation response protein AidB-like acyl-CoA dehydrogenase